MSYDYQQLEADLSELLGAMSFTQSEVGEVEQFLTAGEYCPATIRKNFDDN